VAQYWLQIVAHFALQFNTMTVSLAGTRMSALYNDFSEKATNGRLIIRVI